MDYLELLYDVQAFLNVFFGVILVYYSARSCYGFFFKRPICTLFTFIGLGWTAAYALIFLREIQTPGIPSTGHWTVRPLVTITLAGLAAMSIGRQRRFSREKEIIKKWTKDSD